MLSIQEATDIVQKALPGWMIQKQIDYKDVYLFQVFSDQPFEEEFDPFFSVNKETGEFRDFSIFTDGDPNEITNLFLQANK